ncbi:MAG: SH3 domain-containing protein, partial [Chloroflexaceae bacterium]|nr:SH3 domain-containing protein [Chloroflexaceae bacterium]
MPPRANPRDWERYFGPGAPRRGGPLRALANLLIAGTALALLVGGGFFAVRFGLERARASASATAIAVETSNAAVLATRTARALATAGASAAPVSGTPTTAIIGRGTVLVGGNLRREPRIAPETIIGQICPGDAVEFLEQRATDDGSTWYRVRITASGGACSPQRVSVGSQGWACLLYTS